MPQQNIYNEPLSCLHLDVSQKTFLGHKTEGNTAVICSQKLWYTGAGLGYIYLYIKTCAYFLGEDISVTPNFCTAKVK